MANLGPFRLLGPLGGGGMGTVYEAEHAPSGAKVAVKVLRPDVARSVDDRSMFLREVQANALLDHARIVRVLDAGLVPVPAGADHLVPGSPWLAMELVRGRPLDARRGRIRWSRLQPVALALLDALGHAHARGVVHRDLKPGNVLLDENGQPNLLDFGIAARTTHEGTTVVASGTPSYMAPEQGDPEGRDTGPWTDLFSFGAMVWALVTGYPPFSRARGDEAVLERLRPRPALEPAIEVPEGLEGWLRVLLRPDPGSRYQRAVDAARDLRELGPRAGASGAVGVPTAGPDEPTVELSAGWSGTRSAPLPPPAASALGRRPPIRTSRPRLPGTGLGLWGMRDPPFVGRDGERAALWGHLRAAEAGAVRVVVVHGAPGVGKSRLARWLAEEAHAAGAHVASARHAAVSGPGDGLAAMVARELGARGLVGDPLRRRLRPRVPADALERTLAVIEGTGGADRHAAWVDHLARQSARRVVVVWIDDIGLGTDAQAAVLHLLSTASRPGLRVLVVATADTDGVDPVVDELRRGGASDLALGPMPDHQVLDLLAGLVGLGSRLAADLAARVGGSPLLAVQLVSDWIARRHLTATPYGWDLAPGHRPLVPDDLVALWAERVEDTLSAASMADAVALERAAVLGGRIDLDTWARACRVDGVAPTAELVERLVADGLLTPIPEGWTLAHSLLGAALERRAVSGGRHRAHHLAAATTTDDPSRRGAHLLAAGQPEEALPLLVEGAHRRRVDAADYRGAIVDLARAGQALDLLEVDDVRRGRVWDELATCLRSTGRYAEARSFTDRLTPRLSEPGFASLAASGWLGAAQMARDAGDLAAARRHGEASLRAADAATDAHTAALMELGYIEWWSRDLPAARARFRRALERPQSDRRRADVRYALALVAISAGDHAEALELLELAEAVYAASGHRLGLARVWNARGSAITTSGSTPDDRERGLDCFRRAIVGYASVGSGDEVISRLNVASMEIQEGDDAGALATLEPGRFRFDEGRPFFAGVLELLRSCALAGIRGGPALGEALRRADELLARAAPPDTETADIALRTAERAATSAYGQLAAALAVQICERCGDVDRIARARNLGAT